MKLKTVRSEFGFDWHHKFFSIDSPHVALAPYNCKCLDKRFPNCGNFLSSFWYGARQHHHLNTFGILCTLQFLTEIDEFFLNGSLWLPLYENHN